MQKQGGYPHPGRLGIDLKPERGQCGCEWHANTTRIFSAAEAVLEERCHGPLNERKASDETHVDVQCLHHWVHTLLFQSVDPVQGSFPFYKSIPFAIPAFGELKSGEAPPLQERSTCASLLRSKSH